MNELTLEQTDRIGQFVSRNEIVFSHLPDDLVDHICCDLEDMIKRGVGFDEAFREIRKKIGPSGLKNIQENTLYAVDSKYRKMKKTMKISGVAGTILLGLSSVLKILHLPMAGILISLGALILVAIFLPSSLMVLWKETKSGRRLFLFITAFMASALFIAGVLFKIQHWPGTSAVLIASIIIAVFLFIPALMHKMVTDPDRRVPAWLYLAGGPVIAMYGAGFLLKVIHWPAASLLLIISAVLLALLVVPAYIYYRWRKDEHISLEAVAVIASVVLFLGPTMLISFNNLRHFDSMFLETCKSGRITLDFKTDRNKALFSDAGDYLTGDLILLHEKTKELVDYIGQVEKAAIQSDSDLLQLINYPGSIQDERLFNYAATETIMQNGDSMIGEIDKMLYEYRKLVINSSGEPAGATVTPLPDLESYLPGTNKELHISPVALIQALDLLAGSILDAEAATIRNIRNIENNKE